MHKREKQSWGLLVLFCFLVVLGGCGQAQRESQATSLLNVSFDTTRELYEDYNKAFTKHYKEETGKEVRILQSHGGSGSQARSVIEGVDGDVVSLALGHDVDLLTKVDLLGKDWQGQFPRHSAPYRSTIVFVVRKGNPKGIEDWPDLLKAGVRVVTPNPKSSGGACWNFMAAYAYATSHFHNEKDVEQFLAKLYHNVPTMDPTARVASTTFVDNKQGDVLIAWESEALLIKSDYGDKYEIVYPSVSIAAEPTVAMVDYSVRKHGNEALVKEYIHYLYSKEGQTIAAKHNFRPTDPAVLEQFKDKFKGHMVLHSIEEYGSWAKVYPQFFDDGGLFDRITEQ